MKNTTKQKAYPLLDLVHHSSVKPQLNPLVGFTQVPVVKPKKLTKAKPCFSQMSKELHQYLAGRALQIISALNCNFPEMGKLSNSVEECVQINGGCLHMFS